MGEHLPCKQGVMGSNPIISTSRPRRQGKIALRSAECERHHTRMREAKNLSEKVDITMVTQVERGTPK